MGARLAVDDLGALAAEQAALRRVAALVARGAAPEDVFAASLEEVGRLLSVDYVQMGRYEPDDTFAIVASWGNAVPAVSRTMLGGKNLGTVVFETGRSARLDSYADASGPIGVAAREAGVRTAVATPITVEGRLWGVMVAGSRGEQALPADAEARLESFTELLATTIANAESRAGVTRLAADQAALRRVATLVARGVPPEKVFAAVVEEIGRLLPVDFADLGRCEPDGTITFVAGWGKTRAVFPVGARLRLGGKNATTLVAQTGRPARIESYADASGEIGAPTYETGVRSAVATPVTVEGQLWGVMAAGWSLEEPMPADTEPRLAQFTDLLETAIANAEARAEVTRLAQEQAALRRVATLVASQASQAEVFEAVAIEIGKLLGTEVIRMVRYEDDRAGVVVASAGKAEDLYPVGSRVPLEADSAASRVFRTEQPVRIDDFAGTTGPVARKVQSSGIRSVVAAPILVEGRLWGAMTAGATQDDPLPPGTESRLGQFTELMATAVANTESHARADRLAEEQAALRRVATLVAKESSPAEVFAKVAEELANVLGEVDCSLFRDEGDGTASAVAVWGAGVSAAVPVGTRLPVDGDGVIASVLREGRPCRIGDHSAATGAIAQRGPEARIGSAVGCPIVVGDRIWGAMGAASYQAEAFPPETETRIAQFVDLVATAIANAEARTEVERLADEQAALRRVATLVAEGASPTAVLDAVAAEMEALLDADQVALNRYEPSAEISVLAHRGLDVSRTPVGSRVSHEGESVTSTVRRTGRPARMENYERASGALAELARTTNLHSSVGAPIVVGGRLWGIITASWKGRQSPPADTEERMTRFAGLLDTAIANADIRDQLTASRARIVATTDATRRRFERDLHDGAQQRLVSLSLMLRDAQATIPPELEESREQVARVAEGMKGVLEDLRELSRGIHPAILSEGGLGPALKALTRRSAIPVKLDLRVDGRLEERLEVTAYYVASEALANTAKHAQASVAEIRVDTREGVLELVIRDDGVGGADPARGSGLIGLADRVEALGGTIAIESPAGGGTALHVELPIATGARSSAPD
jgi:GAF domain-containing protein